MIYSNCLLAYYVRGIANQNMNNTVMSIRDLEKAKSLGNEEADNILKEIRKGLSILDNFWKIFLMRIPNKTCKSLKMKFLLLLSE